MIGYRVWLHGDFKDNWHVVKGVEMLVGYNHWEPIYSQAEHEAAAQQLRACQDELGAEMQAHQALQQRCLIDADDIWTLETRANAKAQQYRAQLAALSDAYQALMAARMPKDRLAASAALVLANKNARQLLTEL